MHRDIIYIHCRFHLDDCLLARASVASQHVQDTVGIDFELHPHARHAARRGLEFDRELPQAPVVARPLAFPLRT